MANTPVIDYTARDYESIREEIISFLKANFPNDWTDFQDSNIGVALVDLVAFAFANLSFQLDRMANESYLPTLRLRESLIKIVTDTLGYKLSPATAASLEAEAYINNPIATNISITKNTHDHIGGKSSLFEDRTIALSRSKTSCLTKLRFLLNHSLILSLSSGVNGGFILTPLLPL